MVIVVTRRIQVGLPRALWRLNKFKLSLSVPKFCPLWLELETTWPQKGSVSIPGRQAGLWLHESKGGKGGKENFMISPVSRKSQQ